MSFQYILDTDHLSLLQRSHPPLQNRIEAVGVDQIAITVISIEESVQGWLSEIRKASPMQSSAKQLHRAYENLRDVVQFLSRFQTTAFTESAYDCFMRLRRQGVRIGTQDLRIASIAIVNNLVLITRNHQNFAQVPGLLLED